MPETRLDLDAALAAMLDDTHPLAARERVAIADALGRVVAEAVDAPMSLPPFRASAMDGFALRSSDAAGQPPYRLKVTGKCYAGRPVTAPTPRGCCVRIFTGAVVPDELDSVAIQEDCATDGEYVVIREPVHTGDNVRPAGHDVSAGSRVLDAGTVVSPFDVGWLTACGLEHVVVTARPRIGVFATGDELLEPGTTPGPGQIFDANRAALGALLRSLPVDVTDYGIVGDDRIAIRSLLTEAARTCDVIVTSGGVSVGEADWVREVVEEIGQISLWKLNLKPGKPVAYGRLGGASFFGLPGNPVSTIVTALLLLQPVIEKLCGGRPSPPFCVPARLQDVVRHQPGREEFQRGRLRTVSGELCVSVTGDQSSNRLASFAGADCLIRVPKHEGDLQAGSLVQVLPFRGLL